MKGNSIEEDIKIVENYLANSAINEIDSNFFKNGGWETVDLEIPESMQHILSDYKRVLKENESLQKTYDDCYCKYKHYKQFESISIQKVKDKIEDLEKDEFSKYYDMFLEERDLKYTIQILQELLEGSEE